MNRSQWHIPNLDDHARLKNLLTCLDIDGPATPRFLRIRDGIFAIDIYASLEECCLIPLPQLPWPKSSQWRNHVFFQIEDATDREIASCVPFTGRAGKCG